MSWQVIAQGGAAVGQALAALVGTLHAATGNEAVAIVGTALAALLG